MTDLKSQILSNSFVDGVRIRMEVDRSEYDSLCQSLAELSVEWQGSSAIDRELALFLYSAPQIIRNAHLSFTRHDPMPAVAVELEDIWIELDRLAIACLSGAS
ncbi:MAG: hypothetical protein GY906_11220 [bacterium]|nr:hypothetical protein [bacterium]